MDGCNTEKNSPPKTEPRNDRINWDTHHMMVALVASMRSPDPNTQVGACIVDTQNRIIATGYNGVPRGIDPKDISWARKAESSLDTKYPYIAHAERNAVLNASSILKGSTCYVTLFPCNNCAIELIQSGVGQIVYMDNPYIDTDEVKASNWMMTKAGILIRQMQWDSHLTNLRQLSKVTQLSPQVCF